MVNIGFVNDWAQSTLYTFIPPMQRLSPFLWKSFQWVHGIHSIWLGYRIHKLLSTPHGVSCAAVGLALNKFFGEQKFFLVAVHLLSIAERMQNALQAYQVFYGEIVGARNIFQGRYRQRIVVPLPAFSRFISPSNYIWWQKKLIRISKQFVPALSHLALAIQALTILSLRLFDLYESFSAISQQVPPADLGTLTDASRFAERLASLEQQKDLLEVILKGVGASFGVSNLTSWLIFQMRQTNHPATAAQVASDLAHRTLFDIVNMAGFTEIVPGLLVPPKIPKWSGLHIA